MQRWGQFVAQRSWMVLLGGIAVVLAAAAYGIGVFGNLSNGGFDDPATDSAKELVLEQATFPGRETDLVVVYSSPTLRVEDPAFRSAVTDTLAALPKSDVAGAQTYYDTKSPGLVSSDGHATRVIVTLAGASQDAKSENWDAVKDHLGATGLSTSIGGRWAVFGDVNTQVSKDIARAESISLPIVFLLSLFIFGSLVSALTPTLVGGIAVMGAFAVVRLITGVTDVSIFSINVITLLGMGLAIDYALFVVSRFREELANQPDTSKASVRAAVVRTMTTAGRTVLFSGLIVAASLASLLLFPQNFLRSMGYGGMAAVLVAMLAALTVLPALLGVLGPRIEFGRMPWRRGARAHVADARTPDEVHGSEHEVVHGAWARVAHSVMRRPVTYLVVIVVGMLALGSPFLGAKWGSVDERVLPISSPSRQAADLQADLFGGETSTASIMLRGADETAAATYLTSLKSVAGVTQAQAVATKSIDGQQLTLVQATWFGNSQTSASQDVVKEIRAVEPPSGATALVGGPTADAVDLIDSIGNTLPWMALTVAAVMLVLLFVAFGSVVLPLKAIVMNAVSIAASFGVVTWIFQEGHLAGLFGFTSPGYLDVTQPILMLAILFGLSMDYEVFLLSRVREEWDRTGDNTRAVAAGVQRSGRIITSAALLLAVVIGGFATSGIVFLKMIGVGMLVAVLLDATVVRALLVPATMRLLGRANWYAPGPLARWWERHGHREEPARPAVSVAVPTHELASAP
ncbi:MMPL family transporter [Pedococcus bigeumensis]|uniref:MMPL family transporter n=1 Tax=Pedococcus bigeumensis TaxID=433644 RepID=A0A502CIQ7_9MICO|nr:MMPL family transporter [Pedococcus bigeumensis]TPG12530.1 MMPL family transporter [Pedococcus bigeumensis]